MINLKLKFPIIILFFIFILTYQLSTINYRLFAQESSKEEEAFFVAQKAFEDGFYEVSLGLLERFLKNYPASPKAPEAELLVGRCYFQQNKFLDALNKLEGLLNKTESKNIKDALLYWIAEVHFKGNNFNKAASYYKMIIDQFPASGYLMHTYYSLGWCLFQEHLFGEAAGYFKTVEERFAKETLAAESGFKIAECLYNTKDYTGLKEKIKSYIKSYPKDTSRLAYLHFYGAEAEYYLNNFQDAIDGYAKTISSSDDKKMQVLSKLGKGWAYLKLKRYGEAEGSFLDIKTDNLEKVNEDILFYGKAVLYSETGRFQDAEKMYDKLISGAEDPVILIQAYLGKADNLYNNSDYRGAMGIYKEALERISDSIPQDIIDKLHYGLAWAALKEGEFKEAIAEFQKIAKDTEDKIVKVAALCHIGDAYQDSGDYNKAAEAYNGILKDYPDSFYSDYVQYQLGLIFLKNLNYDGAIMSFSALRKNFPESKLLDDASYALGLSYFQREDYKSSREIFEKFRQEFKDSNLSPQSMYLLGSSLYNLGNFSEAIDVFKDIIRSFNHDAELIQKAEYEIADCYYQMGSEKEAVAKFKILRSKYPDSSLTAEVMWWLGEYYYRRNELNLARRYFTSLLEDFPKSGLIPDTYYALGFICLEESDYQQAVDYLEKVVATGKSDLSGQATITIADIYLRQGKAGLAIDIYRKAAEDYSNLINLIYPKLADLYYETADYAQALNYYRSSLETVPVQEMANIQFKIAQVLQAQGNISLAIEEYLKVAYLYSQDKSLTVKALLRVAKIYEDKDDFKEALNIYARLLTVDAEEAKFAKERIEWIKAHR